MGHPTHEMIERAVESRIQERLKFHNYNPPTAVDVVALSVREHRDYTNPVLSVLVGDRKNEPFGLALPGGFQEDGDTFERTAVKELEEETGYIVDEWELTFLRALSQPDRDPRRHINSVSFMVFIDSTHEANRTNSVDDLGNVRWEPIEELLDEDGCLLPMIGMYHTILSKALRLYHAEKAKELFEALQS